MRTPKGRLSQLLIAGAFFNLISMATATNVVAQATEPQMVFAVANEVGSAKFDPVNSVSAQERFLFHLVYESLVRLNPDQTVKAQLATSWSVSPNSQDVTFVLADDHKFSNGEKVTAEDVKASLTRLCSAESSAQTDLMGIKNCGKPNFGKSVEVLGPARVKIHIQGSPTVVLHQLATSRALVFKKLPSGLVGSGPFQVVKMTADEVTLKKNPHYYLQNEVVEHALTITRIDEHEIQAEMKKGAKTGALMYLVDSLRGEDTTTYQMSEDLPVITQTIIFNNQRFPFNNGLLRRALQAEIYNSATAAKCYQPNHRAYGVIPTGLGGSVAHTAPKTMKPITPAEVMQAIPALKKLSPVVLHQHIGRKSTCLEAALKEIFLKFNLDLTMQYQPSYKELWKLYLSRDHQGFIELFAFKNREAFSILQFFVPGTKENFPNIIDSTLNSSLLSAQSQATSRDRFALYREANARIIENGYVIPIYYTAHGALIDRCVNKGTSNSDFNPFQFLLQATWDQKCLQNRKAK